MRDIAELRRLEKLEQRFAGEPQPVGSVRDVAVPGPERPLLVRMYEPAGAVARSTVLFIHGGGWALGSVELSDHVCRALCRASLMRVASVDYRLAPEHRFPAAVDDVFAALAWLAERPETFGGLAVCGDSAGGNLAAAVALMARDRGLDGLLLQVLIYPALDPTLSERSYATLAEGFGLTRADMRLFWDAYLRSTSDGRNPYAAPSVAADLRNVAPALVITAEFDPLVDEGERYARRLAEAGVKVELRRFEGMIHGFVGYLGAVDDAQVAIDECGAALRSC